MKSIFDCIIIGSGVAGMTAAIYLKRANMNLMVLEKDAPGGQMNKTSVVENYPGITSIDGPSLAMQMYEQMHTLDILYQYGNVIEIKDHGNYKTVITDKEEYQTKSIILATGRVARKLGLEKEEQLIGRGISYCALCDGFFYKKKTVAVIGGGNSALEEALYLSNLCQKVYLIHRKDTFTADDVLIKKVKQKENIVIKYKSVLKTIEESDGKVDHIIIENDMLETLEVSGIFVYIGQVPNTDWLKASGVLLEDGYIKVDKTGKTNIDFIYACGDCLKKEVYQISTAVGDAAIAATCLKRELENL